MKERRDKAEMEATELSPPECQLFWRRLRQYQITRERAYDLALGFPTLDVTELKQQLAEGGNVHDLVPKMLWAFKEAYQLVTRSTADGSSFRELMMSINAQQLPQQAPMPGMPPGYFPPHTGGNEQPSLSHATLLGEQRDDHSVP